MDDVSQSDTYYESVAENSRTSSDAMLQPAKDAVDKSFHFRQRKRPSKDSLASSLTASIVDQAPNYTMPKEIIDERNKYYGSDEIDHDSDDMDHSIPSELVVQAIINDDLESSLPERKEAQISSTSSTEIYKNNFTWGSIFGKLPLSLTPKKQQLSNSNISAAMAVEDKLQTRISPETIREWPQNNSILHNEDNRSCNDDDGDIAVNIAISKSIPSMGTKKDTYSSLEQKEVIRGPFFSWITDRQNKPILSREETKKDNNHDHFSGTKSMLNKQRLTMININDLPDVDHSQDMDKQVPNYHMGLDSDDEEDHRIEHKTVVNDDNYNVSIQHHMFDQSRPVFRPQMEMERKRDNDTNSSPRVSQGFTAANSLAANNIWGIFDKVFISSNSAPKDGDESIVSGASVGSSRISSNAFSTTSYLPPNNTVAQIDSTKKKVGFTVSENIKPAASNGKNLRSTLRKRILTETELQRAQKVFYFVCLQRHMGHRDAALLQEREKFLQEKLKKRQQKMKEKLQRKWNFPWGPNTLYKASGNILAANSSLEEYEDFDDTEFDDFPLTLNFERFQQALMLLGYIERGESVRNAFAGGYSSSTPSQRHLSNKLPSSYSSKKASSEREEISEEDFIEALIVLKEQVGSNSGSSSSNGECTEAQDQNDGSEGIDLFARIEEQFDALYAGTCELDNQRDDEGTKYILATDFRRILTQRGLHMTDEEIEEMMREVRPRPPNGRIFLDQYQTLLLSQST